MRFWLVFALLASTCLLSAGTVIIEKPFTASRGAAWVTERNPDGTFGGRLDHENARIPLELLTPGGAFVVSQYYPQLPTDVTYSGAALSVQINSDTITYSGSDVDLSSLGGGATGIAHVTVAPAGPLESGGQVIWAGNGGSSTCQLEARLPITGGDITLTQCLNELIDPAGRLTVFAFNHTFRREFQTTALDIPPGGVPQYSYCPPEGCPIQLFTGISETVTATAFLTFTYDDPSEVPEPSTWLLSSSVLCAMPIFRRLIYAGRG